MERTTIAVYRQDFPAFLRDRISEFDEPVRVTWLGAPTEMPRPVILIPLYRYGEADVRQYVLAMVEREMNRVSGISPLLLGRSGVDSRYAVSLLRGAAEARLRTVREPLYIESPTRMVALLALYLFAIAALVGVGAAWYYVTK